MRHRDLAGRLLGCSLQALRHTGFDALAARVSEIDSEAFSLPIAKARGLQTGGPPILMGSGVDGRLGASGLRLLKGATGRGRQGLARRRA